MAQLEFRADGKEWEVEPPASIKVRLVLVMLIYLCLSSLEKAQEFQSCESQVHSVVDLLMGIVYESASDKAVSPKRSEKPTPTQQFDTQDSGNVCDEDVFVGERNPSKTVSEEDMSAHKEVRSNGKLIL